ncbi:Molybdopterin converting factor, subunit 1 [Coccomyxa subellipsoidea C-169]|uniref:Molybdopterin converting factor, subunit 1 n=1 Tax=Coccomyxa subellipsoidea (strain C-169) TaxID=574566 RepID=I0Z8E1_COCSC|nr:Molybdopterin converting factor, subunit 1 [Coccomyxa subellipsoidea C-169]EIE26910.1 Molybdopterin converting factor, subunit 1 [Coccomyxa subellipsoidea C-169]|eukprot:XP_005651454.1 Molybdopterin converting factor, subunit 1 [Coccomyxa subellipsoidea C-169]
MKISFLFFARSRELAGTDTYDVELADGASTQDALQAVLKKFPGLSEIEGRCVLALNQEYVDSDSVKPLKDGDEVALIPPISGG